MLLIISNFIYFITYFVYILCDLKVLQVVYVHLMMAETCSV
jgi:hypothetical protein